MPIMTNIEFDRFITQRTVLLFRACRAEARLELGQSAMLEACEKRACEKVEAWLIENGYDVSKLTGIEGWPIPHEKEEA